MVNGRMMIEKLKDYDKMLFQFIQNYVDTIKPKLNDIKSYFHEYTDHSSEHAERVLQIANSLSHDIKLTKYELAIFYFICIFS